MTFEKYITIDTKDTEIIITIEMAKISKIKEILIINLRNFNIDINAYKYKW